MSDPTPDSMQDPWSVTTEDLFGVLRSYRDSGTAAVVATVTDIEGSAYRRPGAKMVIVPEDRSLGAITAGCLEGPVRGLAADVLAGNRATVETFDLMDDDEWGLGLGCNGVIDLLLEPLDESWEFPLAELAARDPVAVLTAVASDRDALPIGSRSFVDEDGTIHEPVGRDCLPDAVAVELGDRVTSMRESSKSGTFTVDTEIGSVDVFVDGVSPAPDFLIFGNQNDVQPVSRIARQAGFRVVVASARGARSNAAEFPHAHRVVTAKPTELADVVCDAARTYAVLMSHNFIDDRLALEALLETSVPYVGLMGPRDRFEEIREELLEDGRSLTDDELDRIATPVGLDLGGGEPVQIALSIVSEALAVHNGRDGGRLKMREGPIHSRVEPT